MNSETLQTSLAYGAGYAIVSGIAILGFFQSQGRHLLDSATGVALKGVALVAVGLVVGTGFSWFALNLPSLGASSLVFLAGLLGQFVAVWTLLSPGVFWFGLALISLELLLIPGSLAVGLLLASSISSDVISEPQALLSAMGCNIALALLAGYGLFGAVSARRVIALATSVVGGALLSYFAVPELEYQELWKLGLATLAFIIPVGLQLAGIEIGYALLRSRISRRIEDLASLN